eukprot:jgi/Tetstr1/431635/TSEL_021165.t1
MTLLRSSSAPSQPRRQPDAVVGIGHHLARKAAAGGRSAASPRYCLWATCVLGMVCSLVSLHRLQQARVKEDVLGVGEGEESATGLTVFAVAPPLPHSARGSPRRRNKLLRTPRSQPPPPSTQTYDDLAEDQILDEQTSQEVQKAVHAGAGRGGSGKLTGGQHSQVINHYFICTATGSNRQLVGVLRGMMKKVHASGQSGRFHVITDDAHIHEILGVVDRHFASQPVQAHVNFVELASINLEVSLPEAVRSGRKQFAGCIERTLSRRDASGA